MQLRAARSRCRKWRPLRYSIPKAMSIMNFKSIWVGKNYDKNTKHFNLDSSHNDTACFGVRYRTTGFSPRRDLSRKLCRSPYFMKGRMTMGFGKHSDPTSKHTPVWDQVSKQTQCTDAKEKSSMWVNLTKKLSHTEEPDDVRVVEVFHARCLIQELFNLLLREAIH